MRYLTPSILSGLLALTSVPSALAQDVDVVPGYPFKEGDVIGIQDVHKLRSYIPEPFWEHRPYFFFEGMQLQVGPFKKDFGPSELRKEVTARLAGTARIGRNEEGKGWLESHVAGTPFPEIDPHDPDAGLKIVWNATHKHDPMEGAGHFLLSFWERDGVRGSLFFQGQFWGMRLSHRIDRADSGGRYFEDDDRRSGGRIVLEFPSEWRTLAAIGYRYVLADDRPLADVVRDAWAFLPTLRRVRRIPGSTEEQETIPGTDFMIEDINGFNFRTGVIQKYDFKYVGEAEVLTPIDTTMLAFPLDENPNLGPYGYSFANDVWQIREAYILEIRRKKANPAYSKKLLWIDKQTYSNLYAAAYDRRRELWKLIYVVHRWSESPAHKKVVEACENRGLTRLHFKRGDGKTHPQVPGGERFLFPIGNVLVNLHKGTGNRIEVWDAHATELRDVDKRRNLDSNRLTGR
jgi:hypothetical protein